MSEKMIPFSTLIAAGPYLHSKNYPGSSFGSTITSEAGNFSLVEIIEELIIKQKQRENNILNIIFNMLNANFNGKGYTFEGVQITTLISNAISSENINDKIAIFNKLLKFTREYNKLEKKEIKSNYTEDINNIIANVFNKTNINNNIIINDLEGKSLTNMINALRSLSKQIETLSKESPFFKIPAYQEIIKTVLNKINGAYSFCLSKRNSAWDKHTLKELTNYKTWNSIGSLNKQRGQYTVAETFTSIKNSSGGYIRYLNGDITENFLIDTLNSLSTLSFNGVITNNGTTLQANPTGRNTLPIGKNNKKIQVKQDITFGLQLSTAYDNNISNIEELSVITNHFAPLMKISVKNNFSGNKKVQIHNGGSLLSYINRIGDYSARGGKLGSKFLSLENILNSNTFAYHYVNQMARGGGPIIEATKNIIKQMGYLLIGIELENKVSDLTSSVDFYSDGYNIYSISSYLQNLLSSGINTNINVTSNTGNASAQIGKKLSEMASSFTPPPGGIYYSSSFINMSVFYGKSIMKMGNYKVSASLFF